MGSWLYIANEAKKMMMEKDAESEP